MGRGAWTLLPWLPDARGRQDPSWDGSLLPEQIAHRATPSIHAPRTRRPGSGARNPRDATFPLNERMVAGMYLNPRDFGRETDLTPQAPRLRGGGQGRDARAQVEVAVRPSPCLAVDGEPVPALATRPQGTRQPAQAGSFFSGRGSHAEGGGSRLSERGRRRSRAGPSRDTGGGAAGFRARAEECARFVLPGRGGAWLGGPGGAVGPRRSGCRAEGLGSDYSRRGRACRCEGPCSCVLPDDGYLPGETTRSRSPRSGIRSSERRSSRRRSGRRLRSRFMTEVRSE